MSWPLTTFAHQFTSYVLVGTQTSWIEHKFTIRKIFDEHLKSFTQLIMIIFDKKCFLIRHKYFDQQSTSTHYVIAFGIWNRSIALKQHNWILLVLFLTASDSMMICVENPIWVFELRQRTTTHTNRAHATEWNEESHATDKTEWNTKIVELHGLRSNKKPVFA